MSGSILEGLPVEVLVGIFGQLDDMSDIDAVSQTCRYLSDVVSCNETMIAKFVSRSKKFSIVTPPSTPGPTRPTPPGSATTKILPTNPYDSIALLFPAKIYSPTGSTCYAWLRMLEGRMARVSFLSTILPPPENYFLDALGSGRWHPDATYLLWRFLEITSLEEVETFLEAMDGRTIIRLHDALDTAISCAMKASTYRSLPAPGEKVPPVPTFEQVMRDMNRRKFQDSTRNYSHRYLLITYRSMSRARLLHMAEMFICEDPGLVESCPLVDGPKLLEVDDIASEKDRILEGWKARRFRELNGLGPRFVSEIYQEMFGGVGYLLGGVVWVREQRLRYHDL